MEAEFFQHPADDAEDKNHISNKNGVVQRDAKEASILDQERRLHLMGLMQGLQRVSRLQEELTNTQIEFRQKRREAWFKREAVWDHDARFMKELQRSVARGSEYLQEDFQRLEQLAAECQAARDVLGPIEHEGIEAERRWEGQIWILRQAENHLYQEFADEFQIAQRYPAPPSLGSSQYESISEAVSDSYESNLRVERDFLPPAMADGILPVHELEDIGSPFYGTGISNAANVSSEKYDVEYLPIDVASGELESDAELGGIDSDPQTWTNEGSGGAPLRLPKRHYVSELYSQLYTDFGTKRDRINKWLEHSTLTSHIEATSLYTTLRDRLSLENKELPSNWAQLVIAYWHLDGATKLDDEPTSMPGNYATCTS